jgi:hypothetical protein
MATLAQSNVPTPEAPTTAAEEALIEAFEELLETMPTAARQGLIGDLRANAVAHGE